ncbi:diaminopimelate decarboxylase [Streptococcus ruminantium]|uniref:Diaminopimelate decarboxylase n=1 Tax=Streptococcus ruminantium TaxID=1917441 RepID=A0ABU1B0Z2_9STRE|nr:diaminopimelate decarboxylase [Streptococcus ruminantium]MDQ8759126.1 diaminopimelate decarboxylase [Streptococcus ruminantium]MDQ8764326.1 diaminopimelate decarboxylase [Streptococcus ruminantium]MDQ8767031.1 diaminopimelate decarboxylase [Streptococcus ruminantium]MDQ8769598.1 diaminopimelate decarboxylase [Streptococcus ruminantium]MDQ8775482.1 diaminopimelate decarboxylase [Streptococcus ruminantium]
MAKIPFISREALETITNQFPTPFHLYDEKGIREKARALHEAFSWNKGFKEYFAVKATPTPAILKILQEEGCGVDCATDVEVLLSEKLGFTDIMFTSNDTQAQEFVYARKVGAIINLDAYEHIDFLKNVTGIPETVCLRYNPGGVFSLGTDIMDHPEESKFGMTKDQLMEGYRDLKNMGVKEFGVHAFLASNTVTNDYYPVLARQLFELALEIREETGVTLDFINLSGGIGVNYHPDQEPNDIATIGDGVRKAYEEILAPVGMGHVKIFTELGRFMLAPHGHLITKVLHRKKTYRTYVGVDASAANLMRPAFYGAYHHITNITHPEAPLELVDVTGSLCENNDKFAVNRKLPRAEVGDTLVIHDSGAHGFSMGYNYNGRLRSAEILLQEDGTARMIRRAETPEDYFATIYGFDFDR